MKVASGLTRVLFNTRLFYAVIPLTGMLSKLKNIETVHKKNLEITKHLQNRVINRYYFLFLFL